MTAPAKMLLLEPGEKEFVEYAIRLTWAIEPEEQEDPELKELFAFFTAPSTPEVRTLRIGLGHLKAACAALIRMAAVAGLPSSSFTGVNGEDVTGETRTTAMGIAKRIMTEIGIGYMFEEALAMADQEAQDNTEGERERIALDFTGESGLTTNRCGDA